MNSTFFEDNKEFFIVSFILGIGGILVIPIVAFLLFIISILFIAANFISLIILILGNTILKPKPITVTGTTEETK